MGGERETHLEKKSDGQTVQLGKLRLHESAGEVHFHDDAAANKTAVPVSDWWKAWERIRSQPGKFEWIDSINKTYLVIKTELIFRDGIAHVFAHAEIIKAEVDVNYTELTKFTKRK